MCSLVFTDIAVDIQKGLKIVNAVEAFPILDFDISLDFPLLVHNTWLLPK